ncbi:MAG: response regulator, partial [Proteobacteria bacterium]|nr:response regulator [Pseudomonadota bacterium]
MKDIRLLLVDDEADFRQAIARRLAKRGLVPEQAQSGQECLTVLAKKSMDVVVLDVKMPGMDGIETLGHIKNKHPKTEVILLTGQATTQDGVEGIKAGAFDYLTKPIELDHLLSKIKQAHEKIMHGEAQQREAEFRAKIEQQMIATERLASLGTLAVGVAHEINNPLAIINESAGWMKLLLKREELAGMPRKADFEKAIHKIETSIERAKKITHQLLGFVQKQNSVYSQVNLAELADEAIQLVSREAINREIKIALQPAQTLPYIRSDPYRLRQVLINLLTNAIHATGSGGQITVTLEGLGKDVMMKVSDTGQGIPKENLEKIFEPFFSTKDPGQGTGLGLFVSKGIIEKLGGTITVESKLGQGSVFCTRLPQYQATDRDQTAEAHGRFDVLEKI